MATYDLPERIELKQPEYPARVHGMIVYRFRIKPDRQVMIDSAGKQYAGKGWDDYKPGEPLKNPSAYALSVLEKV